MQRKRPKKGLSRMDAALDNMRPFGFSDANIRAVVKNLLKVYGDDGWIFIEESGYKVLLDSLLEKAEEEDERAIETFNGNEEEGLQTLELKDGEVPENGNGSREEEPRDLDLVGGEFPEYGNANKEEEPKFLELENGEVEVSPLVGDGCEKGMIIKRGFCRDIWEETGEQEDEISPLLKEDSSQAPDEASLDSFALKAIVPMNSETRTRKRNEPCYGWIEADDDLDDDDDGGMVSYAPLNGNIR